MKKLTTSQNFYSCRPSCRIDLGKDCCPMISHAFFLVSSQITVVAPGHPGNHPNLSLQSSMDLFQICQLDDIPMEPIDVHCLIKQWTQLSHLFYQVLAQIARHRPTCVGEPGYSTGPPRIDKFQRLVWFKTWEKHVQKKKKEKKHLYKLIGWLDCQVYGSTVFTYRNSYCMFNQRIICRM